MVSDSSHCARQTAPRGHETKPFLWGNRSFILISKMHFFFFEEERNRNHPFLFFSLDSR